MTQHSNVLCSVDNTAFHLPESSSWVGEGIGDGKVSMKRIAQDGSMFLQSRLRSSRLRPSRTHTRITSTEFEGVPWTSSHFPCLWTIRIHNKIVKATFKVNLWNYRTSTSGSKSGIGY